MRWNPIRTVTCRRSTLPSTIVSSTIYWDALTRYSERITIRSRLSWPIQARPPSQARRSPRRSPTRRAPPKMDRSNFSPKTRAPRSPRNPPLRRPQKWLFLRAKKQVVINKNLSNCDNRFPQLFLGQRGGEIFDYRIDHRAKIERGARCVSDDPELAGTHDRPGTWEPKRGSDEHQEAEEEEKQEQDEKQEDQGACDRN